MEPFVNNQAPNKRAERTFSSHGSEMVQISSAPLKKICIFATIHFVPVKNSAILYPDELAATFRASRRYGV
jgi:hypothetical protein